MKKKLYLKNEDGELQVVSLGWSWLAFFLPPVWALYYGLWKVAGFFGAGIGIALLAPAFGPIAATIMTVIFKIGYVVGTFVCGMAGNDMRRLHLESCGFRLVEP